MHPLLIGEFMGHDRLAEVVEMSHEAELRALHARQDASRGPRASMGAALVRVGLKLDPAAGNALSPRTC